MAKRTSERPKRKGGGLEPRILAEVGAIALALLALLTLIALVTDQGAILHWWRTSLLSLLGWGAVAVPPALGVLAAAIWVAPLRSTSATPVAGAMVVYAALLGLAQHFQRGDPASGEGAGGFLGAALARAAAAAFGEVGAPIVLLAVLAVGVVVAANRTIAELVRPAWRRRPALPLRPDVSLPGGTGPRLVASMDDDEEWSEPSQLRINLPPEPRSGKATAAASTSRPVPGLRPQPLATPAAAAVAEAPALASLPGLAGLPSAAVAAEGVLHADPPEKPWALPSIDLLEEGTAARQSEVDMRRNASIIEETLAHFSIAAKIIEITPGPVVTRYELKPAAGVKLSRIEALSDDLSLALAARSLRIEAPIPGKSVVGIEIPNLAIGLVSLRDVAETAVFKDAGSRLVVALGRDVAGSPIVSDLAKLPHLLIAGQTGSGKSVCINSIICSLLMNATPDEVRIILADPKRVELAGFNGIPHLVVPVVTDHDKILNALGWAVTEMDRRYRLFARASARNIERYNDTRAGPDRVPYVVLVIDELADLMMTAPIQVEKSITRIAQLARATGIHLVIATQRPSVDVITGLIKANIPARVAFATASSVDSRTILDLTGAEKLLGRGDMLYLPPDVPKPVRAQGVFVSDREIEAVTRHWKAQREPRYQLAVIEDENRTRTRDAGGDDIEDDRYEEAVEIVQRAGQASVSMLQRKMTIGFARAGRLIDIMEQHGVIGPAQGPGKMRDVYGSRPRQMGRGPIGDES